MECQTQTLELTVLSAKDIKKWDKTGVYVVVSISGDPLSTQSTAFSNSGGSHPEWNHDMKFTINESDAKEGHLFLVFSIRRGRCIKDKEIGGVRVPIQELLAYTESESRVVSYNVHGLLSKVRGEIEFRYKFSKKTGPTTAHPVVKPFSGMGPTPPDRAYPYAEGPQMAAGHGPSPSYGHHHPQPSKKKQHKGNKIKSRICIGLGIAGGLIGGLVFGEEMGGVSEAISDFVGGGVDGVADFVGAGVADVADFVGGGVADLVGVADVAGEGVADVVGGGVADLVGVAAVAGEGVADVVGGGVADLAGVADVAGEGIADVADVVGGGVADLVGVADVAGEGVADVADVVGGGVADVANVVGGGVADVANVVGGGVADVSQSVGDIANVVENIPGDAGISAAANVVVPLL